MNMRWFSRTPFLLLMLVAVTAACSRSAPVAVLDSSLATQAVLIGNGQVAAAGTELPRPIVVRVLDDASRPVQGQIVNFVVTTGGGEVYAGAAVSDERGMARDWWTLGPQPGINRLEARAVNSTTGEAIVFGTFVALGR